jgi:CHAD domain-containing protein
MKMSEQVGDLGRRFEIETPHVEQVASLALALLDGFHLDRKERPLLAAAARLHDIGCASDPEHHVDFGLEILENHPLDSFSSNDWKLVGLVVSLHRRKWRPLITDALIKEFGRDQIKRAKRLGAILRIADGLDHSHIQDATILSCNRGRKVDTVRVCSRWGESNLLWAERKADLWEAVFGRSFRIQVVAKRSRALFDGVVRPGDSAIRAARRILYSQYGIMRDQVSGMIDGADSEFLHDYRVALRRFRVALRLFRPLLAETAASELEARLGTLSDRLGGPRDAHVLFEFFQGLEGGKASTFLFFQALEKKVADAHCEVAKVMESDECLETVRMLSRFLRVELPALERADDGSVLLKAFVRCQLEPLVQSLCMDELPEEAEPLHALRKRCRRARYMAEFVEPVCGAKTARLVRRLKAASSALGRLRDIDLHAASLEQLGGSFDVAPLDMARDKQYRKVLKKIAEKRAGIEAEVCRVVSFC